jgi:hypothetical protein
VSQEDLRGADTDGESDGEDDGQFMAAMDAFLVFRAFCKLSAKEITIERYILFPLYL